MSGPLSPEARAYGLQTAKRLLAGRTGHGGGPCTSRVMDETQLAALTALAFQAGKESK